MMPLTSVPLYSINDLLTLQLHSCGYQEGEECGAERRWARCIPSSTHTTTTSLTTSTSMMSTSSDQKDRETSSVDLFASFPPQEAARLKESLFQVEHMLEVLFQPSEDPSTKRPSKYSPPIPLDGDSHAHSDSFGNRTPTWRTCGKKGDLSETTLFTASTRQERRREKPAIPLHSSMQENSPMTTSFVPFSFSSPDQQEMSYHEADGPLKTSPSSSFSSSSYAPERVFRAVCTLAEVEGGTTLLLQRLEAEIEAFLLPYTQRLKEVVFSNPPPVATAVRGRSMPPSSSSVTISSPSSFHTEEELQVWLTQQLPHWNAWQEEVFEEYREDSSPAPSSGFTLNGSSVMPTTTKTHPVPLSPPSSSSSFSSWRHRGRAQVLHSSSPVSSSSTDPSLLLLPPSPPPTSTGAPSSSSSVVWEDIPQDRHARLTSDAFMAFLLEDLSHTRCIRVLRILCGAWDALRRKLQEVHDIWTPITAEKMAQCSQSGRDSLLGIGLHILFHSVSSVSFTSCSSSLSSMGTTCTGVVPRRGNHTLAVPHTPDHWIVEEEEEKEERRSTMTHASSSSRAPKEETNQSRRRQEAEAEVEEEEKETHAMSKKDRSIPIFRLMPLSAGPPSVVYGVWKDIPCLLQEAIIGYLDVLLLHLHVRDWQWEKEDMEKGHKNDEHKEEEKAARQEEEEDRDAEEELPLPILSTTTTTTTSTFSSRPSLTMLRAMGTQLTQFFSFLLGHFMEIIAQDQLHLSLVEPLVIRVLHLFFTTRVTQLSIQQDIFATSRASRFFPLPLRRFLLEEDEPEPLPEPQRGTAFISTTTTNDGALLPHRGTSPGPPTSPHQISMTPSSPLRFAAGVQHFPAIRLATYWGRTAAQLRHDCGKGRSHEEEVETSPAAQKEGEETTSRRGEHRQRLHARHHSTSMEGEERVPCTKNVKSRPMSREKEKYHAEEEQWGRLRPSSSVRGPQRAQRHKRKREEEVEEGLLEAPEDTETENQEGRRKRGRIGPNGSPSCVASMARRTTTTLSSSCAIYATVASVPQYWQELLAMMDLSVTATGGGTSPWSRRRHHPPRPFLSSYHFDVLHATMEQAILQWSPCLFPIWPEKREHVGCGSSATASTWSSRLQHPFFSTIGFRQLMEEPEFTALRQMVYLSTAGKPHPVAWKRHPEETNDTQQEEKGEEWTTEQDDDDDNHRMEPWEKERTLWGEMKRLFRQYILEVGSDFLLRYLWKRPPPPPLPAGGVSSSSVGVSSFIHPPLAAVLSLLQLQRRGKKAVHLVFTQKASTFSLILLEAIQSLLQGGGGREGRGATAMGILPPHPTSESIGMPPRPSSFLSPTTTRPFSVGTDGAASSFLEPWMAEKMVPKLSEGLALLMDALLPFYSLLPPPPPLPSSKSRSSPSLSPPTSPEEEEVEVEEDGAAPADTQSTSMPSSSQARWLWTLPPPPPNDDDPSHLRSPRSRPNGSRTDGQRREEEEDERQDPFSISSPRLVSCTDSTHDLQEGFMRSFLLLTTSTSLCRLGEIIQLYAAFLPMEDEENWATYRACRKKKDIWWRDAFDPSLPPCSCPQEDRKTIPRHGTAATSGLHSYPSAARPLTTSPAEVEEDVKKTARPLRDGVLHLRCLRHRTDASPFSSGLSCGATTSSTRPFATHASSPPWKGLTPHSPPHSDDHDEENEDEDDDDREEEHPVVLLRDSSYFFFRTTSSAFEATTAHSTVAATTLSRGQEKGSTSRAPLPLSSSSRMEKYYYHHRFSPFWVSSLLLEAADLCTVLNEKEYLKRYLQELLARRWLFLKSPVSPLFLFSFSSSLSSFAPGAMSGTKRRTTTAPSPPPYPILRLCVKKIHPAEEGEEEEEEEEENEKTTWKRLHHQREKVGVVVVLPMIKDPPERPPRNDTDEEEDDEDDTELMEGESEDVHTLNTKKRASNRDGRIRLPSRYTPPWETNDSTTMTTTTTLPPATLPFSRHRCYPIHPPSAIPDATSSLSGASSFSATADSLQFFISLSHLQRHVCRQYFRAVESFTISLHERCGPRLTHALTLMRQEMEQVEEDSMKYEKWRRRTALQKIYEAHDSTATTTETTKEKESDRKENEEVVPSGSGFESFNRVLIPEDVDPLLPGRIREEEEEGSREIARTAETLNRMEEGSAVEEAEEQRQKAKSEVGSTSWNTTRTPFGVSLRTSGGRPGLASPLPSVRVVALSRGSWPTLTPLSSLLLPFPAMGSTRGVASSSSASPFSATHEGLGRLPPSLLSALSHTTPPSAHSISRWNASPTISELERWLYAMKEVRQYFLSNPLQQYELVPQLSTVVLRVYCGGGASSLTPLLEEDAEASHQKEKKCHDTEHGEEEEEVPWRCHDEAAAPCFPSRSPPSKFFSSSGTSSSSSASSSFSRIKHLEVVGNAIQGAILLALEAAGGSMTFQTLCLVLFPSVFTTTAATAGAAEAKGENGEVNVSTAGGGHASVRVRGKSGEGPPDPERIRAQLQLYLTSLTLPEMRFIIIHRAGQPVVAEGGGGPVGAPHTTTTTISSASSLAATGTTTMQAGERVETHFCFSKSTAAHSLRGRSVEGIHPEDVLQLEERDAFYEGLWYSSQPRNTDAQRKENDEEEEEEEWKRRRRTRRKGMLSFSSSPYSSPSSGEETEGDASNHTGHHRLFLPAPTCTTAALYQASLYGFASPYTYYVDRPPGGRAARTAMESRRKRVPLPHPLTASERTHPTSPPLGSEVDGTMNAPEVFPSSHKGHPSPPPPRTTPGDEEGKKGRREPADVGRTTAVSEHDGRCITEVAGPMKEGGSSSLLPPLPTTFNRGKREAAATTMGVHSPSPVPLENQNAQEDKNEEDEEHEKRQVEEEEEAMMLMMMSPSEKEAYLRRQREKADREPKMMMLRLEAHIPRLLKRSSPATLETILEQLHQLSSSLSSSHGARGKLSAHPREVKQALERLMVRGVIRRCESSFNSFEYIS